MHTMKYYRRPSALHKVNYNMGLNTEWIITNDQAGAHSDLGNCVIGTRPPYFVARIHAFRTQEKREKVRIQQETERTSWLRNLQRTEQLAQQAHAAHVSVKDYVERTGGKYDEEHDELRLVAKVPGLNVYLELLGAMEEEDTAMERWWQEESNIKQPYDRAIDAAAMQQLNRAAYFYRATTTKSRQRELATMQDDWQPRDDWREQYDPEEFFQRPEKKGIGFDYIDPSRRTPVYVKHPFSEEEKQEYNRLKAEAMADKESTTLTDHELARLQQLAAANVAARKMIQE